jgi:hypothetical protein
MIENEWRDEYCPWYGDVYCENPYPCESCPMGYNCDDLAEITEDAFNSLNSNGDE